MPNGWLANRSIRFKLLSYFVAVIMVSIMALSLLGSTLYRHAIEKETNVHTKQLMEQVKARIQDQIREMDNIIAYLSGDQAIASFLNWREADGTLGIALTAGAEKAENAFIARHPEIEGIMVVGSAGQYASGTLEPITRDPMTSEQWYIEAVREPDRSFLIGHPIGRNIRATENLSADQVLSFAKAVRDPDRGVVLGVVLINMRLDIIQDVVESAPLGESGFIFIMDEQGGVVYSPVNPIVYRIPGIWLKEASGSLVKRIGGEDYQMFYNSFPAIGWRIVGVFPLKESLKVVLDIQHYTLVVALATLLLAVAASWYFTNSIVRPIGKLRSLMKKVEAGELNLRFPAKTQDEIGQLGSSFNNMVLEINNLIQLVYEEQKQKREAELKILQAQIKPHFLYNTLDTIQWMAVDRDADDIVEIVIALTHLFRISLSKGQEIIPLAEELQHVESYLVIQMARYEEKLDYLIDMPADMLASPVLKLLLQPLVENAIYHGIKAKPTKGTIRITGSMDDQKMTLAVEDDGVGIPAERLVLMNENLGYERKSGSESGYGLYNVNERIKLTYGSAYGLRIESEHRAGTRVIVNLPLMDHSA